MRVSVIIPVHDRQTLCERALRSVLAQHVADMETIIVDDGSQSPFRLPADIAETPGIRVIRHDRNRGPAAARNTGVDAARGEWIAFLDSDDYWLAGTLKPRLELAESDRRTMPERMMLYAAGFVIDNTRTGRRDALIPIESDQPIHFASGCWFAPGSTILFRRETFQQIGPYDPTLRRLEDLDWFLRFALAGGWLKVWDDLAAVVEVGSKPRLAALDDSAAGLQAKYARPASAHCLPPGLRRRLDAYLDVERASILAAQRQWLGMLSHLTRSFLRAPRLTLHLERFWRHRTLPQRLEPARDAVPFGPLAQSKSLP
jgi:cellulose synthase/poly-beta-1,6-N-acetylglucosamine synthase-like glycosyltransferase